MAYFSYNVNAFSLPFANIENKVLFKLFMVDPGLVCYMRGRKGLFQRKSPSGVFWKGFFA